MSTTTESAAAAPHDRPVRAGPSKQDVRLFGEFLERFAFLAESASRLSREVYLRAEGPPTAVTAETVRRHLGIVRRLFSGRLLEIMAVLSVQPSVGFQELQDLLDGFSASELEQRLADLEAAELVQREPARERPEAARYVLTHKGSLIVRLGEPVLLYLRLAEGWSSPSAHAEGGAAEEEPPQAERAQV